MVDSIRAFDDEEPFAVRKRHKGPRDLPKVEWSPGLLPRLMMDCPGLWGLFGGGCVTNRPPNSSIGPDSGQVMYHCVRALYPYY